MADAREDDVEPSLMAAALASSDIMAKLMPSLPLQTGGPLPLRKFGGFWIPEGFLLSAAALHERFEPRPDDIFVASVPKSGTNWLKALAFAIINREKHPPCDPGHPLRLQSPHNCVSFVELSILSNGGGGKHKLEALCVSFDELSILSNGGGGKDELEALPSPRVLGTHLPFNLLPKRVTAAESSGGSGCRIVYVCRDHKDALVSWWLFAKKLMAVASARAAGDQVPPPPYPLEQAFEVFCDGHSICGPQWLHVLGFWEEHRRRPDKVLFLRYEEMLHDLASNVRRLAEFMGSPFSAEEEAAGMVDTVVDLCSLDSLKGSNQSDVTGYWRNHLTPEMAARLDGIVFSALQGSGLVADMGSACPCDNDSA